MGYLHVEVTASQSSKHAPPCGDVVDSLRTAAATTVVLADGIGSGIKANIAATLCVSRLLELMRRGFSPREAFAAMARTMNQSRTPDLPYAAFCVARILGQGEATVLSYDMPAPIFVSPRSAMVLNQRTVTVEGGLIGETLCHLAAGDALLLVSDGITQAGLGNGLPEGWTAPGLAKHVQSLLGQGTRLDDLGDQVRRQALLLWGPQAGDDCTAVLAACRPGATLNLLTGPPSRAAMDAEIVRRFLRMDGWKVVCGGTTAKIVAAAMGRPVRVEQNPQSVLAPPRYAIKGIDLVTEGAVTLNQVYNVLDEENEHLEEDSGVTQLHALLRTADRVNIVQGVAANPASEDIAFRQRGVLTRARIIPLLCDKLKKAGKLVVVEYA